MKGRIAELIKNLNISKKSFITFTICLSILFYFLFYTIFGNRGVIDYFKLKNDLQNTDLIKDKLSIEIKNKKNLVDRMQNESLDIDLLDEQARKNLGYAKSNEIIIYQNKEKKNDK